MNVVPGKAKDGGSRDVYDGPFMDDKKFGNGIYKFADGGYYKGRKFRKAVKFVS